MRKNGNPPDFLTVHFIDGTEIGVCIKDGEMVLRYINPLSSQDKITDLGPLNKVAGRGKNKKLISRLAIPRDVANVLIFILNDPVWDSFIAGRPFDNSPEVLDEAIARMNAFLRE